MSNSLKKIHVTLYTDYRIITKQWPLLLSLSCLQQELTSYMLKQTQKHHNEITLIDQSQQNLEALNKQRGEMVEKHNEQVNGVYYFAFVDKVYKEEGWYQTNHICVKTNTFELTRTSLLTVYSALIWRSQNLFFLFLLKCCGYSLELSE